MSTDAQLPLVVVVDRIDGEGAHLLAGRRFLQHHAGDRLVGHLHLLGRFRHLTRNLEGKRLGRLFGRATGDILARFGHDENHRRLRTQLVAVGCLGFQGQVAGSRRQRFFGDEHPFTTAVGRRFADHLAVVLDGDLAARGGAAGHDRIAFRIDANHVEGRANRHRRLVDGRSGRGFVGFGRDLRFLGFCHLDRFRRGVGDGSGRLGLGFGLAGLFQCRLCDFLGLFRLFLGFGRRVRSLGLSRCLGRRLLGCGSLAGGLARLFGRDFGGVRRRLGRSLRRSSLLAERLFRHFLLPDQEISGDGDDNDDDADSYNHQWAIHVDPSKSPKKPQLDHALTVIRRFGERNLRLAARKPRRSPVPLPICRQELGVPPILLSMGGRDLR